MFVRHNFFFAQSTNVANKITLGSPPDPWGRGAWALSSVLMNEQDFISQPKNPFFVGSLKEPQIVHSFAFTKKRCSHYECACCFVL